MPSGFKYAQRPVSHIEGEPSKLFTKPDDPSKEHLVAAAVYDPYSKEVVLADYHASAYENTSQYLYGPDPENPDPKFVEGFWTSKDRFVTRSEGMRILRASRVHKMRNIFDPHVIEVGAYVRENQSWAVDAGSMKRDNPFLGTRTVSGWWLPGPKGGFRWARAFSEHDDLARALGYSGIEDLRDNHGGVRVWADGECKEITISADKFSDLPSDAQEDVEALARRYSASVRDDCGRTFIDYRDQVTESATELVDLLLE